MILPQLCFHSEPRDQSSVFTHPTSTLCYSSYLALSGIWGCFIWQSLLQSVASKRFNNDNSCLHLVNLCDETKRIDWYGEHFFSQSLTCKSVIVVASCCNPGHLRSLFRLVVYNCIVLFVIVINKTTTTDITPDLNSPNRPGIFSGYLWRLCTIKRIHQQVQPVTLQKPHCSLALCIGLS